MILRLFMGWDLILYILSYLYHINILNFYIVEDIVSIRWSIFYF